MFLIPKLLLEFLLRISTFCKNFSDKHIKLGIILCHRKHFPKQKLSFINSCFTYFKEKSYKGYVNNAVEFMQRKKARQTLQIIRILETEKEGKEVEEFND